MRTQDLARAVRLRGPIHATWHIRKLHRHGLLARHPDTGAVVLRDPPPPTRRQRLRLRFLAHPTLSRALRGLASLVILAAIAVALAVAALRLPYRPLP